MTLSAAAASAVPMNDFISWTFVVLLLITACYGIGRVHQWYRQGLERDDAFRDGYDKATRSLFGLATRVARPNAPSPARRGLPDEQTVPFRAQAAVEPGRPNGPRHRAKDARKVELAKTSKFNFGPITRR